MNRPQISRIRFSASTPDLAKRGLMGWVSFATCGLRIYGVAIRRTLDGRLVLSFPERRDDLGRSHPIVRPIDDETRRHIERAVFKALGRLDEVEL